MSSQFVDQKYVQLCSEKTLQANEEGFFLQFAEVVAEIVGEKWIKNIFGRLKTDAERIRKVYQDDKLKNCTIEFLSNVQEVYRKKCSETSKRCRLEAEICTKKGDHKKALGFFSQSVLRASKTDENLPLALFGRSKLLISMEEYSNALTDIHLAIKENLATTLKPEAFSLMAVCYTALGEENKAQVAFKLAEKLSGSSKNFSLNLVPKIYQIKGKKAPPVIAQKHSKFQHASKKITVKSSQEMGRYVVANEDIKTGETLVVEPAHAACLLPEKFGTHCHHCFKRLFAPIGCPDCSNVAFCSPECQNLATGGYHKYECKFLDLLVGSGMSILSHTALRIITQNSLEKSLEIYKNRSKDRLYSLCTNSAKRGPGDFLQRTLMAAFLLRCLQKSGYFRNQKDSVAPTEKEYQIGEMLLFNLQMLQFNAHEVYETLCCEDRRLKGAKIAYIGVAVYPTVALFNHECYPAVTRYFVGKHIVINAIRSLCPNDVVAENYGPIFTCRKLMERQRSLSARYWFNCRCSACLEDWPALNTGSSSFVKRVRCPNESCRYLFSLPTSKHELKCPSCEDDVSLVKNIDKLKWCEGQFELGLKCVENQEKEKAIRILCEALDIFDRVSAAPHRLTHQAQEALRVCLADSGNTHQCLLKAK